MASTIPHSKSDRDMKNGKDEKGSPSSRKNRSRELKSSGQLHKSRERGDSIDKEGAEGGGGRTKESKPRRAGSRNKKKNDKNRELRNPGKGIKSIPPSKQLVGKATVSPRSKTQFTSDITLEVNFADMDIQGYSIGPVWVQVRTLDGEDILNIPFEELEEHNGNVVTIYWETWHKIPMKKYYEVVIIPEPDSPLNSLESLPSCVIYKPLSEAIDFAPGPRNEIKYDDDDAVVFAERFGDGTPLHYMFRQPISLWAKKGYIFEVKNLTTNNRFLIPQEYVKDLDMWLFENTEDRGTGWGNLKYLGKGTKDAEGKIVGTRTWENEKAAFAVHMIQRRH